MKKYIDADKLTAEIERQKRENLGSPECVCDDILSFITSLQQEQPTKGYDEKYLNEKIAKAKKSWDGVDVDEFMDEIRGGKQEQPKDKQIVSIEGWTARDKNGHLNFFLGKPHRIKNTRGEEYWVGHARMKQPNEFFPELSWNDEPIEVEFVIRNARKEE